MGSKSIYASGSKGVLLEWRGLLTEWIGDEMKSKEMEIARKESMEEGMRGVTKTLEEQLEKHLQETKVNKRGANSDLPHILSGKRKYWLLCRYDAVLKTTMAKLRQEVEELSVKTAMLLAENT